MGGTRFDGEFLIKTIFILILLSTTNVNDIFYHCAFHTLSGPNIEAWNMKYTGQESPIDYIALTGKTYTFPP